jgi:hypothetical protein
MVTYSELLLTVNEASLSLYSSYHGIVDCSSNSDCYGYVNRFFRDNFEGGIVKSNRLGIMKNNQGEQVGIIEEHYIDSGSEDYVYTCTWTM